MTPEDAFSGNPADEDLLMLLSKYFPGIQELHGLQPDWTQLPADVLNLVLAKVDKPALSSLRSACTIFKYAVDAYVTVVELRWVRNCARRPLGDGASCASHVTEPHAQPSPVPSTPPPPPVAPRAPPTPGIHRRCWPQNVAFLTRLPHAQSVRLPKTGPPGGSSHAHAAALNRVLRALRTQPHLRDLDMPVAGPELS